MSALSAPWCYCTRRFRHCEQCLLDTHWSNWGWSNPELFKKTRAAMIDDFCERRQFRGPEVTATVPSAVILRGSFTVKDYRQHTIDLDRKPPDEQYARSLGAVFAWGLLVGLPIGMVIDAIAVAWHWFGRGL